MTTRLSKLLAGLFAAAFYLLILTGVRTAPTPAFRLTGIAGWVLVAAGFLSVALAVWMAGRPRRRRVLTRAQVSGQPPVKIIHSAAYAPPPHRWRYRTAQRRR